MPRLKIVATGDSPQAQAQARGKLFEKLMAEVLRHYGYSIEAVPNVNYAGIEIDIEGRHTPTQVPLYAECKCQETEVDSPKLQAFFGKYMARWRKDNRCHGLFIALPGINSHAKGFYRENCDGASDITFRVLQEDEVLKAIFGTGSVMHPDAVAARIQDNLGTPGDSVLLYTDKGLVWVLYVVPPGAGIATRIALFDATGNAICDRATVDYLRQLCPELGDFENVTVPGDIHLQAAAPQSDVEETVEVQGSSACFEYQFPASPEHFVGRQRVLTEVESFAAQVIDKQTSSRGILFEGNSGWGKSSVVLATVARLQAMGHFALAIDSRTASSSQFILRVVHYALRKLGEFGGLVSKDDLSAGITGFEGAADALLRVARALERDSKILFIFLDQFENLFFRHDALKRICDFFLRACDAQTSVVIGFSWKSDLVGLTSEFPYQLRDAIAGSSKRISLDTFSEVETTALLDRLSDELRAPLRKDLRFFLSEFSQGYPWLLKKLCAHVKAQRQARVQQADLANTLLNVEALFQEDLRGLSPEQDEALRRIAKAAPIGISELGEQFSPEVVQSLVHARLVVRIGPIYDVYWDIFRDFLNDGRVPIQENYILRTQVTSVLEATQLLAKAGGAMSTKAFLRSSTRTKKSLYNVVRDMRLLGLAEVTGIKVRVSLRLPQEDAAFAAALRAHLHDRLPRNRLIRRLTQALDSSEMLTLDDASGLLEASCPYISATKQTWRTYARIFAAWMDFADLAIFDSKAGALTKYTPSTQVRERRYLPAKRRRGITIPPIQYRPIETVILRLVEALSTDGRINWKGMKRSTIAKSLAALQDLRFIIRKPSSITVVRKAQQFAAEPGDRPKVFAEAALSMPSFQAFIEILLHNQKTGLTLAELGRAIKEKLGVDWGDGTAQTNAKIMLDWARNTNLAPGVFAEARRGAFKRRGKEPNKQKSLFPGPDGQ